MNMNKNRKLYTFEVLRTDMGKMHVSKHTIRYTEMVAITVLGLLYVISFNLHNNPGRHYPFL